jgi:CheY-like chemotaxis protein
VSTLKLNADGASGISLKQGGSACDVPADASHEKLRRVVYVCASGSDDAMIASAAKQGVELCIIRSDTEFSAFLPAIEEAGITLDLVVIEPNADSAFATLSAKHGIRHRVLSPGTDVLESIADAFERHSRPTLPVIAAGEPTASAAHAKAPDVDVLAVEDNPVNRMVVEQILESLGLNFLVVTDGGDALAKIAGCKPKIMLVDISLPDMDIATFMSRLEPVVKKTGLLLPTVGLISSDSADQRLACRQAGLIDTLTKPLSPEAVDRMLRKHMLLESALPPASPKDAA